MSFNLDIYPDSYQNEYISKTLKEFFDTYPPSSANMPQHYIEALLKHLEESELKVGWIPPKGSDNYTEAMDKKEEK